VAAPDAYRRQRTLSTSKRRPSQLHSIEFNLAKARNENQKKTRGDRRKIERGQESAFSGEMDEEASKKLSVLCYCPGLIFISSADREYSGGIPLPSFQRLLRRPRAASKAFSVMALGRAAWGPVQFRADRFT
jgi:hypothetical protein